METSKGGFSVSIFNLRPKVGDVRKPGQSSLQKFSKCLVVPLFCKWEMKDPMMWNHTRREIKTLRSPIPSNLTKIKITTRPPQFHGRVSPSLRKSPVSPKDRRAVVPSARSAQTLDELRYQELRERKLRIKIQNPCEIMRNLICKMIEQMRQLSIS